MCIQLSLENLAQLDWLQRCLLNARALGKLTLSLEFSRMLLWLTAWLLASYNLIWLCGWREVDAVIMAAGGLLWLLPWLATVRRRHIATLLGNRWE